MWTEFWDMGSGGGNKEEWDYIYIEAPEAEAKVIFYNRFGHNPERVSCTCCGSDYAINEGETLGEVVAFHYDGTLDKVTDLETFLKSGDALAIYACDIKPEERVGDVPEQGYVWV